MREEKIIEQEQQAADTPGMTSVVMSSSKVVRSRSIISLIMRGKAFVVREAGRRISASALRKEKQLFKKILGRDPGKSKYQIRKQLSAGGMGGIYYVHDLDLQRHTILKVILPEHKENSSVIKSFVREARIAGRLEHPNIIPVHELGYLPDYGIYFTMEYIDGVSLLDIILGLKYGLPGYTEKYDFYALINIFRKVCDAVAYAHSKKIIHRDIKPANIMVGNYGEVLLMDWGLARTEPRRKTTGDAAPPTAVRRKLSATVNTTQFGLVKGTPAYMSPEQAVGDTYGVDHYSDIFLLGATLYHIFTLQPPYSGDDVLEVVKTARRCNFVAPDEALAKNHELSEELCRIIGKAMAGDKADRYSQVEELSSDLDDLVHGKMEFDTCKFKQGGMLMTEGESGNDSYIIMNGKVHVFKGSGTDKVTLGFLGEGDIVGEMALIRDEVRTASVVALEDTEVFVLNKTTFTLNLKKLPIWMERAVGALAERLSEANRKLAS